MCVSYDAHASFRKDAVVGGAVALSLSKWCTGDYVAGAPFIGWIDGGCIPMH